MHRIKLWRQPLENRPQNKYFELCFCLRILGVLETTISAAKRRFSAESAGTLAKLGFLIKISLFPWDIFPFAPLRS